jgi:hypothetical protein
MVGETMLLAVPAASIREKFDTLSDRPAKRNRGRIMNTGSSKSLDSGAWRDLYKAALFEVDNARLPERIAQAEKALALRARELFHIAGDNIEEEQALDDTMYALHALRNASPTSHCIPHRSEAA